MDMTETERLWLRPFTLNDCDFILDLLNSEGWIKYIGDRNVKTTEQARAYLENGPLKSYQINGFGLSLVQLKANNKSIGMCGLIKRDYLDHPDIGFAFLPDYTGSGYAYEIAKKVIHQGLTKYRMKEIAAITMPENYSSVKLLVKLGFRFVKCFNMKDTNEELSLYSIDNENYIP
jgi:RimJ/RimL family protein N-acetyltransferase